MGALGAGSAGGWGGSAGAFAPLHTCSSPPRPQPLNPPDIPKPPGFRGSVLAVVVERNKGPLLLIFTAHGAPTHTEGYRNAKDIGSSSSDLAVRRRRKAEEAEENSADGTRGGTDSFDVQDGSVGSR